MSDLAAAEEGVWFRVESGSAASAVRRGAERVGGLLHLDAPTVADLAIVAAELASNLFKHAEDGVLLLRVVRAHERAGVEMVAIDSGPGMADLIGSSRDGHSTVGTLGIGLGSIARQASWYDAHSVYGRGTVMAVQLWPDRPPPPTWAAGLTRPLTGETVSGDGFAARRADGRHQLLVCDGLGHGPLAAAASQAAVRAFLHAPSLPPAGVVEHLHGAISHTRGAALAVAEVDAENQQVYYAGLGNISGTIVAPGRRAGLVCTPGIAGHQRRTIREYTYAFPPDAVLVMHSDGVIDRWQLDDYPGLSRRSPLVQAATLLRDAGVRRDDACVVVARTPDPVDVP